MLGRSNVLCNRYGVGDLESSMAVVVNYPNDTVCTCSDGTRTLRAIDDIGLCVFYIPTAGDWTVSIKEEDGDSDSKAITVSDGSKQNVNIVMYLTRKYLKNTLTSYSGNATSIAAYAFYGRTALTQVEDESITSIGSYGFGACTNLEKVDLKSSSPVTIAANAFNGSTNLKDVIIRSTSLSTLSNVNAFTKTPFLIYSGAIFVPDNLLDSYRSGTNWNQFTILPLSLYPTNDVSTIRDSWEEIFANEANGTYSYKYSVGDTKILQYNGVDVCAQIVAIDGDDLADESGKAPITWVIVPITELYAKANAISWVWPESDLRNHVINNCLPKLPQLIRNNIKEVIKTYKNVSTTGSSVETLWILSAREIGITIANYQENSGVIYSIFDSNNSRIRYYNLAPKEWFVRGNCTTGATSVPSVNATGSLTGAGTGKDTLGFILGFCT